jgi:hypothetical protein
LFQLFKRHSSFSNRLSVLAGDSSTALEARRGNSRIVISTQAGSNPLQKMLELAALMYYSEQVWTVKQN